MDIVYLIAGFLLLIKGADWLVSGASTLAQRLKVSDLAIGLTVVALGTSLPELVVNIIGSLEGRTGIVLGNIVGSNIVNVFLILGAAAIVTPLVVKQRTVWKEIPLSFLAAAVVTAMVADQVLTGSFSQLDRIDGIVLLAFFCIFLVYVFSVAEEGGVPMEEKVDTFEKESVWQSVAWILLGLGGLVLGGKLVVDAAVALALLFGLSETVIGLTVVAIGTSLPELATSIMAAIRKNMDIAIGNVVGSNIINIFFILGVSAFIRPIPLGSVTMIDLLMLLGTSFLLFMWMFIGKRFELERWQGVTLVSIYLAYIVFLVTGTA